MVFARSLYDEQMDAPLAQKTAPRQRKSLPQTIRSLRLVLLLFLFVGVWYVLYGAYLTLDNAGFLRHARITPVVMSSPWMVGEFRDCASQVGSDGNLVALYCPAGVTLSPDGRNRHQLPVRYWGKIVRRDLARRIAASQANQAAAPGAAGSATPDTLQLRWRCQRTSRDLRCWAQN